MDLSKLDDLCRERTLRHHQKIREKINRRVLRRLDEIARMWNPLHGEMTMTRPYGVPHEGQAFDVWYHVLKWATGPSEIGDYWLVSEKFRDILRAKYIEMRLPEIVKLILDKRPNYLLPANAAENWRISTFLRLRNLSSQCKRSVVDISSSGKDVCDLTSLRIGTILKAQRITGTLMESPTIAASFFPTSLVIDDRNVPGFAPGEFHQTITVFLQLAGHRILHFKYTSSLVPPNELYDCLREWAMLVPSLTQLILGHHYRITWNGTFPVPEPFPNLPNLTCYRETTGGIPAVYVQRLLEACPGIADLGLWEGRHVREHSPQVLVNLQDLTSLQTCPTRSLLDHPHFPWKLHKLNLCCEDWGQGDAGDWNAPIMASCRLFTFLNHFEETLEHLQINMVRIIDSGCGYRCGYLQLKNLRTLKMDLYETDSFRNLDFLLYVEKLETLHLTIKTEMNRFIQPIGLREMVERSFLGRRIWDVFPYLKSYRLNAGSRSFVASTESFRTPPQG